MILVRPDGLLGPLARDVTQRGKSHERLLRRFRRTIHVTEGPASRGARCRPRRGAHQPPAVSCPRDRSGPIALRRWRRVGGLRRQGPDDHIGLAHTARHHAAEHAAPLQLGRLHGAQRHLAASRRSTASRSSRRTSTTTRRCSPSSRRAPAATTSSCPPTTWCTSS